MPLRAPRIDVTTGASTCRFSRVPNVLQPESETGNLIKIVQRVPARMCRVGGRSSRRDRLIEIAASPHKAREYLLAVSMISSLKRAEELG